MKIDTKELVEALAPLRPFVNADEAWTNIWFSGQWAYASLPLMGATSVIKTDFSCGVPGEAFFRYVDTLDEEEVELNLRNGNLIVSSGAGKMSFKAIDFKNNVWGFPKKLPKDMDTLELTDKTYNAVKLCHTARARQISRLEHQGLILEPREKGGVTAYACSAPFIMECRLPSKSLELDQPVVVPWRLVQSYLKLENSDLGLSREFCCVHDDWTRVFSAMFNTSNLLSIRGLLSRFVDGEPDYFTVPDDLPKLLRQVVSLRSGKDKAGVQVTVDGRIMRLRGDYPSGQLTADIGLEEKVQRATLILEPGTVLPFLDDVQEVALLERAFVFKGEGFRFFVAAHAPRGDDD